MPRHFEALTIVFGFLTLTSAAALSADLPDLTITEIFLRPTPPDYVDQDVVFIGVAIRNDGANASGDIAVTCNFSCSGHSQRYVSGMVLQGGLASGGEAVLGDQTFVDIRGCFFVTQREFNCMVDAGDRFDETDEANNASSQLLVTGK